MVGWPAKMLTINSIDVSQRNEKERKGAIKERQGEDKRGFSVDKIIKIE